MADRIADGVESERTVMAQTDGAAGAANVEDAVDTARDADTTNIAGTQQQLPPTPQPVGDNTAIEIIDGAIATVDVSKHPVASIPESDLSLADIERSRSRPLQWSVYGVLVLIALIAPYWLGRTLAVNRTAWLVEHLSLLNVRGVAFVSWTVTLLAITGLGLMIVDVRKWLWRTVFVIGLAAEQFIAGLCLLRFNFWYSTYVVYGKSAGLANAANLGIIAAGFGLAVFAVLWVGLLVLVRKDSPLNVLTRSWASFIMFFVIELIALGIVLGALLNMF
ncbi:MAG: hypothetical protein LKI34_04880 [Bifidobacterium tibiigranuli]|jgi:hypothetical protein|uniref:hypothetical protein n=1 Tax=Bifidobacterium tibiigranuli TaxID=2172043 RepID=UPI0026EEF53E|nr:hypothetical protein [Bifidobacterium tibiigranuli]MCI1673533.1 hypothetical protein [Bifidobacterium tibiigranuli]MCI1713872.1 hypothetical protein [Bifidobacterium tibiigranuli]